MKLRGNLIGQFKLTEFQTGLTFSCERTLIVHSLWLHTNYFYFSDSIDIFCSSIMLEKVKSYLSITLMSELYWTVQCLV